MCCVVYARNVLVTQCFVLHLSPGFKANAGVIMYFSYRLLLLCGVQVWHVFIVCCNKQSISGNSGGDGGSNGGDGGSSGSSSNSNIE